MENDKALVENREAVLVDMLRKRGLHISCAESCTGGLLMAKIVSVAAASSVFDGGFVTYSEELKCEFLGINPEIIKKYGVVSEQTAAQMAAGAAKKARAEIGVGITGYAGPSGGDGNSPIGTVCFGFYLCEENVITRTVHFGDLGRNIVRKRSADYAINELLSLLA